MRAGKWCGVGRRGFLRRLGLLGIVVVGGRTCLEAMGFIAAQSWGAGREELNQTVAASCTIDDCLSDSEFSTLKALTDIVIPADEAGPGAIEIKVAERLKENLISGGSARQHYQDGLRAIDELAKSRHGKRFAAMERSMQTGLFGLVEESRHMLWADDAPETVIGKVRRKLASLYYRRVVGISDPVLVLFDQVIRDTAEIYYGMPEAWPSLGYSGPPFPFGYAGRRTACGSLSDGSL